MKPKVIAFYLPQYHPTPDNDKWWGKGFTEWTNVGKAKPLFKGHYQPKVPADLGYYDLRLPEVREAQAELAKEAGIYGFCYYHYWFGNGKEELELPFNEVLRLGKPDFPFMLCWANESWHKKLWNKDGKGTSKEMLIEQTYPGEQDIIDHFYRLLPAFKDRRYIRIGGKPLFMIYKPMEFLNLEGFTKLWNDLALKNGLTGIYFIAQIQSSAEYNLSNSQMLKRLQQQGIQGLNVVRLYDAYGNRNIVNRVMSVIYRKFFNEPLVYNYRKLVHKFTTKDDYIDKIYPTLIPNWDHTPRSGWKGVVLRNSTPKLFEINIQNALRAVKHKNDNDKLIFLKSWNEWGEGNYMEPDLKFGKGFIRALCNALTIS